MAESTARKQQAPHHRLSVAEKRHIVELTLREGASQRAVGREYGVSTSSLTNWRAAYRAGALSAAEAPRSQTSKASPSAVLLPVALAPEPERRRTAPAPAHCADSVHITLASGATLRLQVSRLDAAFVCALMESLQR